MYKKKKYVIIFVIDPIGALFFIIFTFIPFIAWVFEYGPKKDSKIIYTYVDYISSELIEERECTISFGNVFFLKKIPLHTVSNESEISVYCKPLGKLRRGLPKDCYEENKKDSYKKICLKKNIFYTENEVEIVYIHERTKVDENYKKLITIKNLDGMIEILNDNYHEIKRYPLKLPKSITLENLKTYFREFEYMTLGTSAEGEQEIILYINLPPKQGNQPGKKIINLSS
ncbi:MAG: hypothetical protein HWN66_16815 [Candidatus Helarchaeota archaeon]|nr:hypothetical protein [Candidatus Helarchaeota archaeon]